MGWLKFFHNLVPEVPVVQCWNILQMTSKWRRKISNYLSCSEPTNEEETQQIKQHVARSPSLSHSNLYYRSLSLSLDLDCFDKLSWRCFESLKQRPSRAKSIKQWDSTDRGWQQQQELSDSSSVGGPERGRGMGREISNNTLKCCPLKRWKNVNISYALWRCCRAEEQERSSWSSWRLGQERRYGWTTPLSQTTAGQNIFFELLRFAQWAKLCRVLAFLFSFSFLSSIFALQHLLLARRPLTLPPLLDEVIIFIWFIMSPVGRKHLLTKSIDSSFWWCETFKVKYATILWPGIWF